eukprot:3862755-Ditylum_brightwellii.AAC.1
MLVVIQQRVGMPATTSFLMATKLLKNPHQQKVVDGDVDVHYNDDDDDDDDDDKDTETNTSANTSKKKETALTKSIQLFCEQSDDTIASVTSFMYEYLQQKQVKSIEWTIMNDTEYITDNKKIVLPLNDEVNMLKKINWSNMNEAFFGTIFPSIVVHGENRDWKVKCCYTFIIAAAGELECGIDNLWK